MFKRCIMSQNKLKMILGIAAIVFAVVAVVLFSVGVFAIHAAGAQVVKVLMIIVSVLCLFMALELGYMLLVEKQSAPNFFLFNSQTKRNIPVQKLSFQTISARLNRYLSNYAPSEGKLWTDGVLENPELDLEDKFKPAVAYKLFYDLAEKDTEQAWTCFELASVETVDFLCRALELNNDAEIARTIREIKNEAPLNLKSARDYIVKNRTYLKTQLCRYIYDNIRLF